MIADEPIAPHDSDAELVESYGSRALRTWAAQRTVHHPEHDCLLCADGRAMLRRNPLPTRIGGYVLPVKNGKDHR